MEGVLMKPKMDKIVFGLIVIEGRYSSMMCSSGWMAR